MTTDTTYNGWTNYATWVVKLWMDNEQGSQEWMEETARECLQRAINDDRGDAKDEAVTSFAEALESYHDEMQEVADMKVVGVFADLLTHALGAVEWREIARNVIDDIEVWSAGWNMPGYMPEVAPAMFLDADDALEYIRDEVERSQDYDEAADDAETAQADLDSIKADSAGEFGATFGDYHYFVTKL